MGRGRDFVIEGDEYDSAFFDKTAKFLKYLPDIAVDQQRRVRSRRHLRGHRRRQPIVPPSGDADSAARPLLIGADSPRAAALREQAKSRVETFGTALARTGRRTT
jgi:UDP-N-acetylmuramate: L-alanyl-gamma-D-glutamyl-meso-diaminopimelate ligase